LYLYAGKNCREFIFSPALLGRGIVAHELDVGTLLCQTYSGSLSVVHLSVMLASLIHVVVHLVCHSSQCGYVGIVRRTAACIECCICDEKQRIQNAACCEKQ